MARHDSSAAHTHSTPNQADSEGVQARSGSSPNPGIKDGFGDENDYDDDIKRTSYDDNDDDDDNFEENNGNFNGTVVCGVGEPLAVRGYRKQVSIETHPEDYVRMMSLQYKAVMAEICLMTSDNNIDHDVGKTGCSQCDKRMSVLQHLSVSNAVKLRDNITYVKATIFEQGFFLFNFLTNGMFYQLPTDKMQKDAFNRTDKLLQRLNRTTAACAKECSYKLRELWARRGLVFLTKQDLLQRTIFHPLHCVLKGSSASHSCRMTIAPNSIYKTKYGEISFNDSLQDVKMKQPSLFRFALSHLLSYNCGIGDLTLMFSSVHLTYESSLANCIYCYKTAEGGPTFVRAESKDGMLHPIRNTLLSFGSSQAPAVAQYCLAQTGDIYLSFHKTLSPMDKYLCDILISRIKDDSYADDLSINIFARDLVKYAQLQNIELPCLSGSEASLLSACACNILGQCNCNITRPPTNLDQQENEYFKRMRNISDQLLFELCQKLLQILNFSGFMLKHLLVGKHLQPRVDVLIREQDAYEVIQERRQHQRPSHTELREHMELLTNRHSSLKISQITPEEKLCGQRTGVQHLGSLYRTTDDQEEVELVNQSISFIYVSSDRKTLRCRSPDFFSFDSYQLWSKEAKPIFSKRSICSLIAKNADYSGNFLVLFKTKLKTLLRIFLQRNPTALWDDALSDDETDKLVHCLEAYFVLVRNTKYSSVTLKLHYARHHLYLCSDASEHIVAISLSLVSEFTQ